MKAHVLDWLDEIVYIVDIDSYELVYMNNKCRELTGVGDNPYLGKKCYKLLQGKETPCSFCTTHHLQEDKFYEWEFYRESIDRYYHIKDKRIFFEGRPCRFEMAVDITEIKKQMLHREKHHQALVSSLMGPICRVSEDGLRIIWYDDKFLGCIGYTKEQFEAELGGGLGYVHAEDRTLASNMIEEARTKDTPVLNSVRMIKRDGTQITMLVTVVCNKEVDNSLSFYSMGVDITDYADRLEAERASLHVALEAAKKANLAKSRFLSRMSHELRTPLNGIIGMAQVGAVSTGNENIQKELHRKINSSGKYLLTLLNDILDISNIESNTSLELHPRDFLLGDLLGEISAIYAIEASDRTVNFSITLDYFPEEALFADFMRLKQVLGNLLSNAFKFTPPGGTVALHVRRTAFEPGKMWIEFAVQDSGPGISSEFMDRIFNLFEQEDTSTTTANKGIGLGLTISKRVVDGMGGTLEIESNQDTGTRCVVCVPLQVKKSWYSSLAPDTRSRLSGLRVLIADTETGCANMEAIAKVLDLRLDTAHSGAEAMELLHTAKAKGFPYAVCVFQAGLQDLVSSGLDKLTKCSNIQHVRGATHFLPACDVLERQEIRSNTTAPQKEVLHKPYMASALVQALSLTGVLAPQTEARTDNKFDFKGKILLLVEDNAINREVATELLSKTCNFTVESAENGQVAVDMFGERPNGYFDLVLMDICMPVMDGLEAARRIRANAQKGGDAVPIVALSANAFDEDKESSRQSGMNAHLPKPMDMSVLCPVLANLLYT